MRDEVPCYNGGDVQTELEDMLGNLDEATKQVETHNEPSGGRGFSPKVRETLEKEYPNYLVCNPKGEKLSALAAETGLARKQVTSWYIQHRKTMQKQNSRTTEPKFTSYHIQQLDQYQEQHPKPNAEQKREVAAQLSLTVTQVHNYYDRKERKRKREVSLAATS